MNRKHSILFGSIGETIPRLFLDPPTGANEGGGAGNGGQQQQQQPPAVVDPFQSVDLDMQPDHIREAIIKSRETLQRLQDDAQQGQTAQQTAQQLQQQIQQLQQQIEQGRQTQQRQAGQQPPNGQPPTVDAQMEQYYIEQGLPAEQAKRIASMNKGMLDIYGRHLREEIGQGLAPIAGRVINDGARDAFTSAVQSDRVGWSQVQEIQQGLWERVEAMAAQGQLVNPNVVENLAKILWVDHVTANGGSVAPNNVVPMQQPQNHSIPIMGNNPPVQQQSRFTFPGAGNVVVQRQGFGHSPAAPLDAETQAAINATTGAWSPQLQEALRRKNGTR